MPMKGMTEKETYDYIRKNRITHCAECGELNPISNFKFCSTACHSKNRLEAKLLRVADMSRHCLKCGADKPIENRKYCSRVCAGLGKRTNPRIFDKICKFCDKPFQTRHKPVLTCSKSCARRCSAKTLSILRTGVCKFCEKEFSRVSAHKPVYCSDECKYSQQKANQIKYYKTNTKKNNKHYQRRDKEYNLECDGCARFFWSHNPLFRFCMPSCAKNNNCDYYDLRRSIDDDSLPITFKGKVLYPMGSPERPRNKPPKDGSESAIRGNTNKPTPSGAINDPYTRGCDICGEIIKSHKSSITWCSETCRIHVKEPERLL